MKNLISIVAVGLIALALQYFFPWWTLAIPCLLFGFLYSQKRGSSFGIGFVAIGVLWLVSAAFIRMDSGSDLAEQVAGLFPGKSLVVLLLMTTLIGGLAGGLSSWLGYELRRLL